MGRKQGREPVAWEGERTMADAEADDRSAGAATRCMCGAATLVLQAFFEVTEGKLSNRPIEMETLTCPECGREYEPVELEDGRIARGDYLGQVDLAADDEEDFA